MGEEQEVQPNEPTHIFTCDRCGGLRCVHKIYGSFDAEKGRRLGKTADEDCFYFKLVKKLEADQEKEPVCAVSDMNKEGDEKNLCPECGGKMDDHDGNPICPWCGYFLHTWEKVN